MSYWEKLGLDELSSLEQKLLAERQRLAARKSLTEWARYKGFEPAPHHKLIIKKLEDVARGKTTRLALFLPPGSAKSTYASILFPPWFLAQSPTSSIIAASHTTELAEKWGRRVRNTITEDSSLLGISLAGDSHAVGRWALAQGGEYYAAGVGVGIAGFRADLAIIDDPIRSREDAESETIREKVWDWYKSDLITRLKPDGRVILVQTRWHEDDLAGRLLEDMKYGGEKWEVINLPAQAEENDPLGRKPGEWLWANDPNYDYASFLKQQKATQLPRNWSALYQQNPVPDSGNYFQADWLRPYTHKLDFSTLRIYGASDFAVTDRGGDFTVHGVLGIDPSDRLYLIDIWRGQTTSDVWVEAFCDFVEMYHPIGWAFESGQIKGAVGPFLKKRMMERKCYIATKDIPSKHDKTIRAQSIRGRMAMCGLYVPIKADWYPSFRSELLAFPAGKWDDQADVLSLLGQLLDVMIAGEEPNPNEGPKILSTDPWNCTVTLEDVFKDNEERLNNSRNDGRI